MSGKYNVCGRLVDREIRYAAAGRLIRWRRWLQLRPVAALAIVPHARPASRT